MRLHHWHLGIILATVIGSVQSILLPAPDIVILRDAVEPLSPQYEFQMFTIADNLDEISLSMLDRILPNCTNQSTTTIQASSFFESSPYKTVKGYGKEIWQYIIKPELKFEYNMLKFFILTDQKAQGMIILGEAWKAMKSLTNYYNGREVINVHSQSLWDDLEVIMKFTQRALERELTCLNLATADLRGSVTMIMEDGRRIWREPGVPRHESVQKIISRLSSGPSSDAGHITEDIIIQLRNGNVYVKSKVTGTDLGGLDLFYEIEYAIPRDL